MDFKFSKDSGNSQQDEANGEKKNQSALLVLLLILVGGFAYLYFFTALIKPQEAEKAAIAPAAAPQAVKMPLPARDGEPAAHDGKTPEKAEASKAAAAPVTAAAPAAKSAAAPAKPVSALTAKPAPVPAKPQEEPKKVESAKPADKKPQPSQVAEKSGVKVAATRPEAKKPAVADKKSDQAKDGAKKAPSVGHTKPAPAAKAKITVSDTWSLVVGNYVLEEALSADMGRVRKAGFEPIVRPSVRKKMTMSRLFVSEFNDRTSAQSTLEKLKRHTSDAFVMEQGGRFAVYAGSYLQGEAASSEKERLKEAGFTAVVKRADIAIPSQSLSVGPFKGKKAADSALGKLKSAGIKAALSQK